MIVTILCIWILLTFPLVKRTLKDMEEQGIEERDSWLLQVILLGSCMLYVPYFYFLVIANFIVKLIKRK